MGGGMGGGGPRGGAGGPPPDGDGMTRGDRPDGGGRSDPQREALAIQSVSLAFLDATLRNDDMAAEWLTRNGPIWLEAVGQLQWK